MYINPYFSSLIELWVEGAEWETITEQIDMGKVILSDHLNV